MRRLNHIFHDWHTTGKSVQTILEPKCGPYDPRSEEDRTRTQKVVHLICCRCGDLKTKPYYPPDPW